MLQFWQEYDPRGRERSSKKQVYEEWKKIRPDNFEFEKIMNGLRAWKNTASWRDGFAPGAHRFLRLRKYEELPGPGSDRAPGATRRDIGWTNEELDEIIATGQFPPRKNNFGEIFETQGRTKE